MKASTLLSVLLFSLVACQKEAEILPKAGSSISTAKITSIANLTSKPDTIPDKAQLKIKLCKDSINTDETTLFFDHKASINYVFNEDAVYFAGFGQVSLAS